MTMQSERIRDIARRNSVTMKSDAILRHGGEADDFETIDDRVPPLHLIDVKDRTMMEELYDLLQFNHLAIDWYLTQYVFPETMRFQELKVSACGQVLGAANMLFHRRLGFSGTPSDMLPIDLGRCRYDKGALLGLLKLLLL